MNQKLATLLQLQAKQSSSLIRLLAFSLSLFFLISTGVFSAPGTDFAVEKQPVRMTFDGENVWVTNAGSDTITRFAPAMGKPWGNFL